MTLDNATKIIAKAICKWVEESQNEVHCIINFASVFIHHAKGILKHTQEFKYYNYLSPLKQRNIMFSIANGRIISCYVSNQENNASLKAFNEHLEIYISEYNNAPIADFEYSTPVKEEKNEIINLTSIDNFKF